MSGFEESGGVALPHYHGHRERLRGRFRQGWGAGMEPYELLELVLCHAIPRKDTKPLAKQLLARFGSLTEIMAAPPHLLKEFDGIGDKVVDDLRLIKAVAERFGKEAVHERPVLSSWSALLDYCRTFAAFEEVERFHVLYLDKKNKLIENEMQGKGTVDHTPVYPRQIVRRALELSASAVILVHNHPSGDPTPSRADIQMTQAVIDVAKPLGIVVHDHIVIGREGHVSFKGLGLI